MAASWRRRARSVRSAGKTFNEGHGRRHSAAAADNQEPPSFPCRVGVLIRRHGDRPLSHSARDYVRAFDLTSIALWRDGLLGVSPNAPSKYGGAQPRPPGKIVRAANAQFPGRSRGRSNRFLPGEQVTSPLSENPPAARVGLFGRSECDRADRGARWAAVALKQPLIRELARAPRPHACANRL